MLRGNLYVVGYGSLGPVVVRAGRGSCLERHTIEGESPAPCLLLPHVFSQGLHESGCLGLQLQAGRYTSSKSKNIRMGPTAHK